jgi:hypothetical protein
MSFAESPTGGSEGGGPDPAAPAAPSAPQAGPPSPYLSTVRPAVEQVWKASDFLCSKRLAPFLPDLLEALKSLDEVTLSADQRTALLHISPATIDPLLRPVRRQHRRHGLATTRPSLAALRVQVPLRTSGEWTDGPPGHLQADRLAHCGDSGHNFYLTPLLALDVAPGWTRLQTVGGKCPRRVGTAVHLALGRSSGTIAPRRPHAACSRAASSPQSAAPPSPPSIPASIPAGCTRSFKPAWRRSGPSQTEGDYYREQIISDFQDAA